MVYFNKRTGPNINQSNPGWQVDPIFHTFPIPPGPRCLGSLSYRALVVLMNFSGPFLEGDFGLGGVSKNDLPVNLEGKNLGEIWWNIITELEAGVTFWQLINPSLRCLGSDGNFSPMGGVIAHISGGHIWSAILWDFAHVGGDVFLLEGMIRGKGAPFLTQA